MNNSEANTTAADAADRLDNIPEAVVIDRRKLERECFVYGLMAQSPGTKFASFGSLQEWRDARLGHPNVSVILLVIGSRKLTDLGVANDIAKAVQEFAPAPIVVVADTDDLTQILKALECGAKGFIPTTVGLRVASEAIAMTLAGGVFVPASSVMAMRNVIDSNGAATRPMAGLFTARQMAVVEALRRGRANKIIAHELQLRESTVKVHIRNIMKKLNATNRTEVAFKIRDMFPDQSGPDI
ncbi:response regulator transcription factor [Youhaiella tibetensis]|uniref:Response regulator transcription factor n=1 Tax=Paradevosia tibetensis TaxID=1447062 RepID=A0A5B9DMP9_9HYPH|nr:response regulator transcription factor [Youhaiella tibetensis]